MKKINHDLFEVALRDYNQAREELSRPEHDVVIHSVCHLTREATVSLLRVYLDAKGIVYSDRDSLEELIIRCKESNEKISSFDFSMMSCSHLPQVNDPANYCLSENRVTKCFSLLDRLKDFMQSELNIKELQS